MQPGERMASEMAARRRGIDPDQPRGLRKVSPTT
jgi:hypothetical protein